MEYTLRVIHVRSIPATTSLLNIPACSLFSLAIRAGANASSAVAWAPSDVLDGLDAFLEASFGRNLLARAPGGGIENTGIARAVNEALLQAQPLPRDVNGTARWALSLFAMWPRDEPAAFSGLLAKGGFAVSAAYDNTTQAVVSPITVVAQHTLRGAAQSRATLVAPWGAGRDVTVHCGGILTPTTWESPSLVSFDAPARVSCLVALSARGTS